MTILQTIHARFTTKRAGAARRLLTLTAVAALAATAPSARAQTGAEPSWLTAVRAGTVHRARDGAAHAMGAMPSSAASLARSPRFIVRGWSGSDGGGGGGNAGARPESLLLTDYLPPVRSQGHQGSCVAWSSAYYCYTYAVSKQRQLPAERIAASSKLQFSPAFLYHLGNGGKDGGMTVSAAFQLLHDQGCASLEEMPYDAGDFTSAPGDTANEHAARFKARNVGLLFRLGEADPDRLKTYLAETRQPFVMSIPILNDFPQKPVEPGFVYRPLETPSRQNIMGLHAITIVGYDDSLHAFRMVNSWGPEWGDHGFLWLDEGFVHACAMDGCSIVAGGIVARDGAGGALRVGPHVSLAPPAPGFRARSGR